MKTLRNIIDLIGMALMLAGLRIVSDECMDKMWGHIFAGRTDNESENDK